jgi:hypothetical protein
MGAYEYRLIAGGWLLALVFLGIFWFLILRRLAVVLKEHLDSTRSHYKIDGMRSLIGFLLSGAYNDTGDERQAAFCKRLRMLLFGYLGVIVAYIVFLVIYYPRF